MNFGGMRGKSGPTGGEPSGARETRSSSSSKSNRRSSLSSWAAGGISGAFNTVKSSLQTASAAADRFERRLFQEYDDEVEFSGDADAYGTLCAQRGQGQRAEFESRCVCEREREQQPKYLNVRSILLLYIYDY